jgi:hypothetical protein
METAEKVLELYQGTYFDLSVKHFHEKRCRYGDVGVAKPSSTAGFADRSQSLDGDDGVVALGRSLCRDRRNVFIKSGSVRNAAHGIREQPERITQDLICEVTSGHATPSRELVT